MDPQLRIPVREAALLDYRLSILQPRGDQFDDRLLCFIPSLIFSDDCGVMSRLDDVGIAVLDDPLVIQRPTQLQPPQVDVTENRFRDDRNRQYIELV